MRNAWLYVRGEVIPPISPGPEPQGSANDNEEGGATTEYMWVIIHIGHGVKQHKRFLITISQVI